jgi:hypothetical protein
MAFGKSIRIYLKDGNVSGLKFGEVVNYTIQAIACPRLKTKELSETPEARRPGVYFLFGKDEETNEDLVYIGEAENVFDRLQSHIVSKDFWNEVVIFISKDDNLTKAHVKYLESRIIQIATSAMRYKIDNSNQPQLASLPLADRDSMEEFLLQIKMLIGIFGHKVLDAIIENFAEPIKAIKRISEIPETFVSGDELHLSVSGLHATAIQTNEGIVVLAGSDATSNITQSLSFGYRDFRQKLIDTGALLMESSKYKFAKDVLFSSPSAAAAIIVGYSYNGAQGWKNSQGKSLKTIEQETIKRIKENKNISSETTL